MSKQVLDDKNNGKTKTVKEKIPDLLKITQSNENNSLLKDIRNSIRGNTAEEKTKFSIAEGLQDFEKVPHFTEYRDFNEVLRMNKLEMWIKLAPAVFGNTERNQAILNVFADHRDQHKINMRSFERKGEKAIVDILRADSGEVPEVSGLKKFTGIGK